MSIFERIASVLWIGGLWAIGYVVAPTLFAYLPRAQAGEIAGRLFSSIGLIGLCVGAALLVTAWRRRARRAQFAILVGMLLCVALGQFVLQPMMGDLKAQGLGAEGAAARQFGILHGVSSGLYLLTSVLGLVYVIIRKDSDTRLKRPSEDV